MLAVPSEAICREGRKTDRVTDKDNIQIRDVLSKADGAAKFVRLMA